MFILLLFSRLKQFLPVMQILHAWIDGFSLSAAAILMNVRLRNEHVCHIWKMADPCF